MRNRLLAEKAGIEPTLVTFDSTPHYPQTREALREQRLLVDPMRLLNIFEWYREHDVDDLEPFGDALPDVDSYDAVDEPHPDGSTHRTAYSDAQTGKEVSVDFRRSDGSVYLRIPSGGGTGPAERAAVTLANTSGKPVARWPSVGAWRQHWIRQLARPGVRAFVMSDNRFQLPSLVGLSDDQFHVVHQIHNIHLLDPRVWNSEMKPTHAPVLLAISQLDGLVTLTKRHREDVIARFGATRNLFVVSNPVDPPSHPDPLPARDPRRFAIVSRLARQKRLEDALRVFAHVLKEEPDATLDIFGDGTLRGAIEAEISKRGLEKSVFLRGFDPRARETLWTATGFLMTSRAEGYPLSTLESLSRGCPVISYDIKYGPREQVTHGVDGFLVDEGDVRGMADRVVELIRNPELVARMSEAAFEKATHHGGEAFLEDWRNVLGAVVEAKQHRTTLRSVTLSVTKLRNVRAWSRPRTIEFSARLDVDGESPEATLDSAVVTLELIDDDTGLIVAVPMAVRRADQVFELSATVNLTKSFRTLDQAAKSLRLRLVWENSSWETRLSRPGKP